MLPTARFYVDLLTKQMPAGRNYKTNTWTFADGSWIQVHVFGGPNDGRALVRMYYPPVARSETYTSYYLESGFIIPSQELVTTFETVDGFFVRDIRDAVFIHNERVPQWQTKDPRNIKFNPEPTGSDLAVRTLPLSLGFDEPDVELTKVQADIRRLKTLQHFGAFDVSAPQLMYGRGSGTSTGRMVLYQRAKLGRKVSEWVSAEYVLNDWDASHNCTGLVRDVYGEYWIAEIEESVTVTFTKLYIWPVFRKSLDAQTQGTSGYLFSEGFALGYSQRTSEVLEVAITNAPNVNETPGYPWKPLAYSWKFNWDGTQAKMVVHRGAGRIETVGSVIVDVDTQVWTLDFIIERDVLGDYVGIVTFEAGETHQWNMSPDVSSDNFWRPSLFIGSKVQTNVIFSAPSGLQGYSQPVNVPLYGWYVANAGDYRNNTWQLVEYTRERDIAEGSYSVDECLFAVPFALCGSNVTVGGGEYTSGISQNISYKVGSIELTKATNASSRQVKTVEFNESGQGSSERTTSGSSMSLTSNSGSGCDCNSEIFVIQPVPGIGDHTVTAKEITVFWTYSWTRVTEDLGKGLPSASFVIPHDCAEGALIASKWIYDFTTVTENYVENAATPAPKYMIFSDFVSLPSGGKPPNAPAGEITTSIGAGDPASHTFDTETEYYSELNCYVLGRDSSRYYSEAATISDTDPLVDSGGVGVEAWAYGGLNSEQGVADPLSIWEAFGGEMMIRGAEDHFLNDFPSDFGDEQTPPVLLGSI
jgi:hypothetical protein